MSGTVLCPHSTLHEEEAPAFRALGVCWMETDTPTTESETPDRHDDTHQHRGPWWLLGSNFQMPPETSTRPAPKQTHRVSTVNASSH